RLGGGRGGDDEGESGGERCDSHEQAAQHGVSRGCGREITHPPGWEGGLPVSRVGGPTRYVRRPRGRPRAGRYVLAGCPAAGWRSSDAALRDPTGWVTVRRPGG
ncbi:MAG TPA: hypothetical protein VIM84_03700, partial [Gemmatimonadales bacterium]